MWPLPHLEKVPYQSTMVVFASLTETCAGMWSILKA